MTASSLGCRFLLPVLAALALAACGDGGGPGDSGVLSLDQHRSAAGERPIEPDAANWESWRLAGVGSPLRRRPLASGQAVTGAAMVVDLPVGWDFGEQGVFDTDVEIFVLEGRLDINGHGLAQYSYFHLPAGVATHGWRSAPGAVLLLWASDALEFTRFEAPATSPVGSSPDIIHRNYYAEPFGTTAVPGVDLSQAIPDFRAKVFRDDPAAGVSVWMTHEIGKRAGSPVWHSYPVRSEIYVLEGRGDVRLHSCAYGAGARGLALRPGAHVMLSEGEAHARVWNENGGYQLLLHRLQGRLAAAQPANCL